MTLLYVIGICGIALIISAKLFTVSKLFFVRWIPGTGINLVFISLGAILFTTNNIENNDEWIGRHYKDSQAVVVTIQEPLVEKPKSYKALARIESLIDTQTTIEVKGDMLVYFKKDSIKPGLQHGSQIVITKPLQRIANSGNPGAFDYRQYCAFQDIHYQVFLKPGEYEVLQGTNTNRFQQALMSTREWVLKTLRRFITTKNELAVAEALLIGYRDDLDKELVQSYSNTGVVHIIAISGLHLGMIYGLLVWIFMPFQHRKWSKVVKPLTIIAVLWAFTFIAGAVPSILRSAVMFTFIVAGQSFGKRTSIYNTLAASAFLMLAYNPFYLWDVGFQLSYGAVLSIIIFQKYITNWFYFQNKLLNGTWRLCALSLAAQILTLPVVLYHFHQFPNLFLFTNMIVVPLSALILFAEIFLLIISPLPAVAAPFGNMVEWMIDMMNTLIERTDRIPFAVTDGIQVNATQTVLMYLLIIFAFTWLITRKKTMLFAGAISLLLIIAIRSAEIIRTSQQQKLIVYNIPQHMAADIIDGGNYRFFGDSSVLEDRFLQNFHLRPSRILNRISEGPVSSIVVDRNTIRGRNKTVVVVDQPLSDQSPVTKAKADAIIITGNPRLYISNLLQYFDCNLLVFDATNPSWKIRLWKKDCDSLHLRHYSVPEQGAFEMDL